MHLPRFLRLLAPMFLALFLCTTIRAGELDDFESDLDTPRSSSSRPRGHGRSKQRRGHHGHVTIGDSLVSVIFAHSFLLTLDMVISGGVNSMDRILPRRSDDGDRLVRVGRDSGDLLFREPLASRRFGEPLLPFARLDTDYQYISSDVEAFNTRLEVGYGPFAFEGRKTEFREFDPSDELDLYRWHVLYRMSYHENWELGFGLGRVYLEGNEDLSGDSFTSYLLIYPHPNWGVEYRPTWSSLNDNTLSEHDLGVMFSWDYFGCKLGYRWLYTENEDLSGPYVGLNFRF